MKPFLRRLPGRGSYKSALLLWSTAAMITLLPTLTDFLGNRDEAAVQGLVLPIFINLSIATLVAAVMWRFFQRNRLGGFVGVVLAAQLLSGGYESRLGNVYPIIWAFSPFSGLGAYEGAVIDLLFILIIFVFSAGAGWMVSRLATRYTTRSRDIIAATLIAIAATFVFQVIPTIQTLASAWPQYFYTPPKLASTATAAGKAKPDIYYIVLDRYASSSVLSSQFGYDNSDFLQFLNDRQYTVNANAHQNYPYTTMSIASTLNANYLSDPITKFSSNSAQTLIPYHRGVQYSSAASKLKSLGYEYDQIGTWYDPTSQSPLADKFYLDDQKLTLLGHRFSLDSFSAGELKQSPLWRLVQQGITLGKTTVIGYSAQQQTDLTNAGLQTLRTYASHSTGGHFVFAHLLIPHDPYNFNADGSLSTTPESDNVGKPIKQKYLGQLQYINSQMKPILSQIEQTSHGQAVVILQSDEGPYPIQLNDGVLSQSDADDEVNSLDMRKWSDTDLAMKYGNLAAYHIPAASPSDLAAGANNLNVFRLVFNTYFGDTMPYLGQCYYAFPNGRKQPFVYDDITARLTGQANTTCASNGSGPKPQ